MNKQITLPCDNCILFPMCINKIEPSELYSFLTQHYFGASISILPKLLTNINIDLYCDAQVVTTVDRETIEHLSTGFGVTFLDLIKECDKIKNIFVNIISKSDIPSFNLGIRHRRTLTKEHLYSKVQLFLKLIEKYNIHKRGCKQNV